VHYAARDGWYSVVCVSSVLIVNFKRLNLCDLGWFSMITLCPFLFGPAELELANDERACMPLIQPVKCIGLGVLSALC
jgi:hypothetical protein